MSLEAHLQAAVADGDIPALISVYIAAAEAADDQNAACFLLTQAYVYALDCGDARAPDLRAKLVAQNREPA